MDKKRGFLSFAIIIGVVAVAAILGGAYYFAARLVSKNVSSPPSQSSTKSVSSAMPNNQLKTIILSYPITFCGPWTEQSGTSAYLNFFYQENGAMNRIVTTDANCGNLGGVPSNGVFGQQATFNQDGSQITLAGGATFHVVDFDKQKETQTVLDFFKSIDADSTLQDFPFTAVETNSDKVLGECRLLADPSAHDTCLAYQAILTKNVSLCGELKSDTNRATCVRFTQVFSQKGPGRVSQTNATMTPTSAPKSVPTSTSMTLSTPDLFYAPGPGWRLKNTGINHSIAITVAANPRINNAPIQKGDYIGVFYIDDNGVEKPGGFAIWEDKNTAITAWGDDIYTTPNVKDGFVQGEQFIWKIWRASDGRIFDAKAKYAPVGPGVLSDGTWQPNGISVLTDLSAS